VADTYPQSCGLKRPKGERKIMTYRQLIERIAGLTDEQKDQDVTIHVKEIDEYYQVSGDFKTADRELLILDEGHVFLEVEP